MKKLTYLVLIVSILTSCVEDISYSVRGTIKGINKGEVIMCKMNKRSKFIFDAFDTVSIKDGEFTFTGNTDYPVPVYLTIKTDSNTYYQKFSFMLSNNNIDLEIDSKRLEDRSYKLGQTLPMYVSQDKYNREFKLQQAVFTKIYEKYSPINSIEKRKEAVKLIKNHITKYASENPRSYVALGNYYKYRYVMFSQICIEELEGIEVFQSKLWETSEFQQMLESYNGFRNSTEGKLAPDFTAYTKTGDSIKLSNLRGQYVLLDIWASWCHYCREETPLVNDIATKYASEEFTVLGVSIDSKEERWLKALAKDQPKGIQTLMQTNSGQNSKIFDLYGFTGIPMIMLIDKEGRILQKNLRGEAIESALKDIFGY